MQGLIEEAVGDIFTLKELKFLKIFKKEDVGSGKRGLHHKREVKLPLIQQLLVDVEGNQSRRFWKRLLQKDGISV